MALSRIGAGAADGTTITIPVGHQIGDLIVMCAFRNATTAPSLPAGWTNITTGSGGASSFRAGYKVATNGDTSGTWTNATALLCAVYRGQATNKIPVILGGNGTTTGTTINYGSASGFTLECPGTSWLVGFGVTKTLDSSLETAPAGMSNIATNVGAAVEVAGHDTNGVYISGRYPQTAVVIGGTSAENRTTTLEIKAEQGLPNNYQSVRVGDGISTGEKIR